MKTKTLLLTLALAAFCPAAMAQEESADTVVVLHPQRVTVTSTANSMSVDIEGSQDNPDYRFSKSQTTTSDGLRISSESTSDFDFKLPFTKSHEKGHRRIEMNIAAAMSFGLVSGLNTPEGLDINMGQSFEITWHCANIMLKGVSNRWEFSTGAWLNWKNFRMTGYNRFVTDNNAVVLAPYPDGSVIRFSRIHLFSWQFPLLADYRIDRHFHTTFGCLFNLNSHGSLKTRYRLDGENYKDIDGSIHLKNFTVDFIAMLDYRRTIGLYVKYSPCRVLDAGFGPRFSSISTGVTLLW